MRSLTEVKQENEDIKTEGFALAREETSMYSPPQYNSCLLPCLINILKKKKKKKTISPCTCLESEVIKEKRNIEAVGFILPRQDTMYLYQYNPHLPLQPKIVFASLTF